VNGSLSAAAFSYGPYFALFGFLGALMYRWGILRNAAGPAVPGIGAPAEGALCLGFSILMGGHLVTAIAPGAMRVLLADLDRVAVIESVGLMGALLFAWGVGARLRCRLRALRAGTPGQGGRVLVLALLLAVCCSGIYLTVSLRWITAWYAYISVPYVRSLLVLEPVTGAVVASPFPVKLHLLMFMALLASWPLAGLDLDEIFPLRAVARRIGGEPRGQSEGAR
jgi:hypothetical protein